MYAFIKITINQCPSSNVGNKTYKRAIHKQSYDDHQKQTGYKMTFLFDESTGNRVCRAEIDKIELDD